MSGKSNKRTRPDRFYGLFLVLALGFVGVAGRLVWVQGVAAPAYAKLAAEQRVRDIVVTPRRGVIYDREGEPLAISVEARTVYAVPPMVVDATATAQVVARTIGGDPVEYAKRLQRRSSFAYLARKIDLDKAKALEALKLKGIGFIDDSKRTYPSGELACQVLGFVGVDDKGLAGIEKQYDGLLGGKAGSVLAERDPAGRIIPGGVMKSVDAVAGHDVVLTIDKDIQYQAQLELGAAVVTFRAKSGSVLVMDPRSGEILAMASTPTFNPNGFRDADARAFDNRPVSDTYEPGSTAKTFTAAAVLDKGLFTPASMFHLPPTIRVGGRTIGEAHDRGTVDWPLADIISNSSNVGAVKLGMALGKTGIYDYYARFGFAERTGVDFPGEARGVLPPPATWSASSIGNIPFGQGMSVTTLQLARALSAVADEGETVTPHFLLDVPGETSQTVWPKERVISRKAAGEMVSILERVVTQGTGKAAAVAGYRVAGKTGTAQKAKNGSYAKGAFVGSFAGFMPADDPRVLIVVWLDEPTNGYYGGTVAAPVFSRLAQFCVMHLKIPPTSPVPFGSVTTATAAPSAAKD